MVNCFAFLISSLTSLVLPHYQALVHAWMRPFHFGEQAFMLWLLIIGGRRCVIPSAQHPRDSGHIQSRNERTGCDTGAKLVPLHMSRAGFCGRTGQAQLPTLLLRSAILLGFFRSIPSQRGHSQPRRNQLLAPEYQLCE